jgi:polar amino acid transport system substrate-binding protein
MRNPTTRRQVISSVLAAPLAVASHKVWAQAAAPGQGLLTRLRAAKSVTIGVVNFLPYSGIDPNGSLSGITPALLKIIMQRIGVPELKGVPVGGYGDLIPGLQAGRWDIICASLTITRDRCSEVAFSDPMVIDGGAFISLKSDLPDPPKTIKEVIERKLILGSGAGGAYARYALQVGLSRDNLREFPNEATLIDGLIAKRCQIVFQGNASITRAYTTRNLSVDKTYPVADYPMSGSSCAFRKTDPDLHEAVQKELRAMKASGEFQTIAKEFGFEIPANLVNMTAEEACAKNV